MSGKLTHFTYLLCIAFSLFSHAFADQKLVETVKVVTKGVGAIGIFTPLEAKAPSIMGSGFVVGDGSYAITNYHVVDKDLDPTIVQYYVFLSGVGQKFKTIKAEVVAFDPLHDLALLKLSEKLPPLTLANDELLPIGTDIAFTGFPIGAVLGLFPATHRGIVAAITPDAIPAKGADQLSLKMLQRLGTTQLIYQLDATAYPGNSGSAVYDQRSGQVVGVINKVIVKDTKESALSSPSGISYAVPVKYVHELIKRAKIPQQN
ncbi:hypothetical protein GCM10011338_17400 [Alteromonas lipolytica]|uniref:Peptidase S1 n=2 Tax=Alteromonas lipolytica TaxID=1856405 RepID=A0A1E8FEE2_9ALTE|nr:peptidase S1 [Alteromonas lipolytica]GGF65564.1 hypothetical protein GCM10011338_17400 [Alteromonas lipolytica]